MPAPETIRFSGAVLAVKARIRLIRSFDQVSQPVSGLHAGPSRRRGARDRAADRHRTGRLREAPVPHRGPRFGQRASRTRSRNGVGRVLPRERTPARAPRTGRSPATARPGRWNRRTVGGLSRERASAPRRHDVRRPMCALSVGPHDGDRDHPRPVESVQNEVAVRDALLWATRLSALQGRPTSESPRSSGSSGRSRGRGRRRRRQS
jgi:hypothetical protein